MRFATDLLADTSDLATSTAAGPSIGWQIVAVVLVGLAGLSALLATHYAYKRLVPVKVRKR
jgi:hypothetical protein